MILPAKGAGALTRSQKLTTATVYGLTAAQSQSQGLQEAESLGMKGLEAQAYATKNTALELGLTAYFGKVAKRFGAGTTEESLTAGARQAVRKIGEKVGVKEMARKLAVGSTLEAAEEGSISVAQQLATMEDKRRAGREGKFNWEDVLVAASAGALTSGAVEVSQEISNKLQQNRKFVSDTVGGAVAADRAFEAMGTDEAIVTPHNLQRLAASTTDETTITAQEFQEMTGLKRKSKAFRESFTDTLAMYTADPGQVVTGTTGVTDPGVQGTVQDQIDSGVYTVSRVDNTPPDATKPHGAYYSIEFPGFESPHSGVGGSVYRATVRPENPLILEEEGLADSAGFLAAKRLLPGDVWSKIVSLGEMDRSSPTARGFRGRKTNALLEFLSGRYPGVDWSRYEDAQEAIEGVAGIEARNAGHDAIVLQDSGAPEFSEISVLDASIISDIPSPSVLLSAKSTDTGIQPLPLQNVVHDVAPPPKVHDQLIWDDTGALQFPSTFPPDIREDARAVRSLWDQLTVSIGEEMTKQAGRVPAHQKFRAKAMAEHVLEEGNRTLRESRFLTGRLDEDYDRVASLSGQARFNAASLEAQSEGRVVEVAADTDSRFAGWTGAESRIQELVEQKVVASEGEVNPRLAEFVEAQVKFTDRKGQIAEESGVRRTVTPANMDRRLAELGAMTDQQMEDHFRALLPADPVPEGKGRRAKMIEKLQSVEFFKNKGGNVWTRIGTDTLMEIRSQGEGHPLWAPLAALISQETGIPVRNVEKELQSIKITHDKMDAVEVPRVFEWFPSTITEPDGTRHDLLVTHPHTHAIREHNSFTHRLGVLRALGDKYTTRRKPGQKERVSPIDQLHEQAVRAGLDPSTVNAYLNGVAGIGFDKRGAVESGGEGAATTRRGQQLVSMASAGAITLSAPLNLLEFTVNARAIAGTRRAIRGFTQIMRRGPKEAEADLRRSGAFAKEYADMTLDRSGWIASAFKVTGNALLRASLVRESWNFSSRLSAVIGKILADDLRAGRATEWDRKHLVDFLGYTEAEADALYDRTATDDDYMELVHRFAARTNSTRVTNPADEARIRASDTFRKWMPLTRHTLMMTGVTSRAVGAFRRDFREWRRTGDDASRERAMQSALTLGNYLGGAAASGAMASLIRTMLLYGPEEGLGLEVEQWRLRPIHSAFDSLINSSAPGLVIGTLWHAARRFKTGGQGNVAEAVASGSFTTGVATEAVQLGLSLAAWSAGKLGVGRYRKLDGPVDMAVAWAQSMVPITDAAGAQAGELQNATGQFLLPFAIGQRDQELNAARIQMFRFLDKKGRGPGSGSPGGMSAEDAEFQRAMHAFTGEVMRYQGVPGTEERMEAHLLRAIGTNSKEPSDIAASIRGRKLLRMFKGDAALQAEFMEKYPRWWERLNNHDLILEAWANMVHRPRN